MALVPNSQQRAWPSFSKTFPPELQDRTIDFGHNDKEFLFSCSLVCKSWVPATRFHIFSKRARPYKGSTQHQIVALCKLLEAEHCTIASYIKHLQVTKNDDRYSSYIADVWFSKFCQTLGAQASLRLESLDLDVDLADLCHPNLKESLSSLTALNLSVKIGTVEKDDISQKIKEIFEFLSGMKLLESLGLKVTADYSYRTWSDHDGVQVLQPASIPRLSLPGLRKLTLRSSICNAVLPWLTEPGLVYLPALSFVSIQLGRRAYEETVNSAVLQKFLDTMCGKTVQDLVLCVAWENLSALNLCGIHAVKSIDLHGIGHRREAQTIGNAVSTLSPVVKERGVTVYTHLKNFNPPEIVGVDWRDMSWRRGV